MDGADSNLTGVWQGKFAYPRKLPENSFVAVLLDGGASFTGTVHEPDYFDRTLDGSLYATIIGQRRGSLISFLKTYDGHGGQKHSVRYEGTISSDGTEISGTWTVSPVWSGNFVMVRPKGKAAPAKLEKVEAV